MICRFSNWSSRIGENALENCWKKEHLLQQNNEAGSTCEFWHYVFELGSLPGWEQKFSLWRHFLINSDFLLRGQGCSDLRMKVFSKEHNMQIPVDGRYVGAAARIDQVTLNLILFLFRFQMCLDKPVFDSYFSWLNDSWWLLKRSLKVFEAWPMYSA